MSLAPCTKIRYSRTEIFELRALNAELACLGEHQGGDEEGRVEEHCIIHYVALRGTCTPGPLRCSCYEDQHTGTVAEHGRDHPAFSAGGHGFGDRDAAGP